VKTRHVAQKWRDLSARLREFLLIKRDLGAPREGEQPKDRQSDPHKL